MHRYLKPVFYTLMILGIFSSCMDDSKDITKDELSDYARNYLNMHLGGGANRNSMASGFNANNPANESLSRLNSNFGAQSYSSDGDQSVSDPYPGADSLIFDNPWVSCAVITTVENPDGSTTVTYDYGDGCEEGYDWYKYFMFGKYSSTYKYEQSIQGSRFFDTYYYSNVYDNYGGKYQYDSNINTWLTNGSSVYSGTSEYDTAKNTYKGSYEYEDNTTYAWDDDEYTYKGSGKSSYTEKGSVVERSNYEYVSGKDFYRTTVLKPLVSDYSCNPWPEDGLIWRSYYLVYVSGRERIEYSQDGQSGSFEIDYGNGECDMIVTIIENGKRMTIDLAKDTLTK